MKVILLEDIRGVGKRFDIKEVKEGYFRNVLQPKRLAEVANREAIHKIEALRAQQAAEHTAHVHELETQAKFLEESPFVFPLAVGEKGEVFGSVSARELEAVFRIRGAPTARPEIETPIKIIGDHSVVVTLGEGIQTTVIVRIIPKG